MSFLLSQLSGGGDRRIRVPTNLGQEWVCRRLRETLSQWGWGIGNKVPPWGFVPAFPGVLAFILDCLPLMSNSKCSPVYN